MPSKTKKQANFMAAVANNPKFAKRAGVPQSVGRDFAKADKGKTFQEGGYMPGMKSSVRKSLRDAEAKEISRQDNDADGLRRVKSRKVNDAQEAMDSEEQEARYETGEARARAKLKKMRDDAARQEGLMMGGKVKGYKKGGKTSSASSRADGIARKGHTRGKMV